MKASRVLLQCVSPFIQQMKQKLFVSGDTTETELDVPESALLPDVAARAADP